MKRVLSIFASIVLLANIAFAQQILLNDTVAIPPERFQAYKFQLSAGTRIRGNFRAQGGNNNDIKAYLFDYINYENFRNGNEARAYYNSGPATVGEIDLIIPKSGVYYLVFQNPALFFAHKVVKANLIAYTPRTTPSMDDSSAQPIYSRNKIIGFKNLSNGEAEGCDGPHKTIGTVVRYSVPSDGYTNVRLKTPEARASQEFPIRLEAILENQRKSFLDLLETDNRLKVTYYFCGSGGHIIVDEVLKAY